MEAYSSLVFCLVAIALLSPGNFSAGGAPNSGSAENSVIGGIFDCSRRVGKEQRVAMEMAIGDLYRKQYQKLIPRVRCTHGDPLEAAQAARHLIKKNGVQAIVGPSSWEETRTVAEVAGQFDVPILSLSGVVPPWATVRWPHFLQASPSTKNQTKAVAAIIESWGWHSVNLIYEDSVSTSNLVVNGLYKAFQASGVKISGLVALPDFVSEEKLHKELVQLRRGHCRVFVVHTRSPLAARVFAKAKEMKMVEKDYVWITTDSASSLLHSMDTSSMQGVVGVRRYFPDTGKSFDNFSTKFVGSFHRRYQEGRNHEPGIFALQAYDIAYVGGLAIIAGNKNGTRIVERIQEIKHVGLSGKIKFKERKLEPVNQFEIISVYGKKYHVLGFWSAGAGRGFSKSIDSKAIYNSSMASLGNLFWPGGVTKSPRDWHPPTIRNPLLIGVPNGSLTKIFVNVECPNQRSPQNCIYSGFSIDVFRKAVLKLKYDLNYTFIPSNKNYTDLVKQVGKEIDAAVGDIAITSERYEYAEFTHAHTESGVVMVVPIQSHPSRAWLFLQPFTIAMWLVTVFISVYTGIVIWFIERNYIPELRSGSPLHQTGTFFLWLTFSSKGSLHSNFSKMAVMVWLIMALVLTQSYTASLSSLLTVPQIKPKITNIETLLNRNEAIGCSRISFVRNYLVALKFNENIIKDYDKPEHLKSALKNGEISAAFLEVPVAKLFVATYCKSFIIAGPTYKVGGYGYAFPKGSPLVPDIDEALLKVFETREQKDWKISRCIDLPGDNDTSSLSLSPRSFTVLFTFCAGTSTAALVIYYFREKWEVDNNNSSGMGDHKGIWLLIYIVLKKWRYRRNRLSKKVRDIELHPTVENSSPN